MDLLRVVTVDLVSNFEAQLARAKIVTIVATSYEQNRDPQAHAEIARHLQRIRTLHDLTADILFSADVALDAAHPQGETT